VGPPYVSINTLAEHHAADYYVYPETQFLCSSSNATLWTNALGIIAAITIARLFRLLLRLYKVYLGTQETVHTAPEEFLWHPLLDWRRERQGGAIMLYGPESDTRRINGRAPLKMLLKVVLPAVSYFSILACITLTASLATDSTALSDHAACGIYQDSANSSDEASLKAVAFNAELESAALTEKCFNTDAGADGCNFFLQQSIPYQVSSAPCPFRDATMCSVADSQIVHFSTGAINARAIGINTAMRMQFSRDTTCSPITVNETFAEAKTLNGSLVFYYYYGATQHFPLTSITMAPLQERERPSMYSVRCVLPVLKIVERRC
jgi:hypothetical protein